MKFALFTIFDILILIININPSMQNLDPRNIENGISIYEHGYCDQPYVIIGKDGTWICTFTTSSKHEGSSSQYIVAVTSNDQGKTWSNPIEIEPPTNIEASWVMPLMVDNGRIYAFYIYNGDNIHELDEKPIRADMLGWYCYKYSDDNGKTWSERYRLPVRVTECDLNNQWNGEVQIMWGIGKPTVSKGSALFGFTKLGKYMLEEGEGWFFRSDNIMTEQNPSNIKWQMLPDGDHGLRSPEFGSVQEEHNIVPLSNGDLYCMYRTTTGHPINSYSRDDGITWSKPEIAKYSNGRHFKNPRACPRIWKTKNGKYLFWYHNHSGKDFADRNPAWISGGIEKDGFILWSQPEILLYSHDLSYETGRLSYPDLIEQDGRYWITTTQKTKATIHEIEPKLLNGLWNQFDTKEIVRDGLVLSIDSTSKTEVTMPTLPSLIEGGFTIELWIKFDALSEGQVIIDSRDDNGKGIALLTTDKGTVEIVINDGNYLANWDCDQEILDTKKPHHIAIVIDGAPNIITFVIDGVLCDGGEYRQYGWGRFSQFLDNINNADKLRIMPNFNGKLKCLKIYDRYLRNSEIIGNFNKYKDIMLSE